MLSEYGKDKIFVLGHSWGTLIGLELAIRHPDWLHAYVGMGQVINMLQGEAAGYVFALDEARRRGDALAIQELESIAPYPKNDGTFSVEEVIVQRKWVTAYGGLAWGRDNLDWETALRSLSPLYTEADLEADERESVNVTFQLLP